MLGCVWLFWNHMDCSWPDSSVHGISKARILEWVSISFSKSSSWLRDQTCVSCTGRWVLHHWATREAHHVYYPQINCYSRSFVDPPSSVQLLSHVWLCNLWTTACQASLTITNSQSLLKLMSIELVMPSNYLILCCPLILLSSIFPTIRVFSKESVFCIRWTKYWSFSFSISPYDALVDPLNQSFPSKIFKKNSQFFFYLFFFFWSFSW